MKKKIDYDLEGTLKVLKGAILLDRAIGSTYGPKGRNVLIKDDMGRIRFSKDGKKVGDMIELVDPMENMGAKLLKTAVDKTAKQVGDGTTTTVILATALFINAIRYSTAGANPASLLKGIQLAVTRVKEHLTECSKPILGNKDLINVALVASNGDKELADLLVEAIGESGENFSVHLEKSVGGESRIEKTNGFKFEDGFVSRHYITDIERQVCEFESPAILVTDLKIQSISEILPLLEEFSAKNKPFVILCDGLDESVLGALTRNIGEGNIKFGAVKVSGRGNRQQEKLEDIAISTGSKFISKQFHKDLNSVHLEDLGTCGKIVIDEYSTLIIDGSTKSESYESHVENLKRRLNLTVQEEDKEDLRTRIGALTNGLVKVELAAASESELIERMERAEDAIHALRGALEEGVVVGGGHAYFHAKTVLQRLAPLDQEIAMGIKIVIDALSAPLTRLISNSGKDPKGILGKLDNQVDAGYNVQIGEYQNLYVAGIIDPVKTLKLALDNASSIAGLLISSVCFVTEVSES
ncbi:MAG: chaperonin GroEL [Algoriphagus aquaeductus]|uniref:chaperonin GroEL n=1 Tax=Algoriphagus aquaeductus TaxID=475299 RepID=UPI00391DD084